VKKVHNLLIDQLVESIQQQSLLINSVQEADPQKAESYRQSLKCIAQLRGRPALYPYISSGIGQGPFVQLQDGSIKLDFICGIGPHILGHSHPRLIKSALLGALEDTTMQGHLQFSEIYKNILEKLMSLVKSSRLKQAWICPSGSMANENALKAIRQKQNGARKIVAFKRAFAGRTTLMTEITDNPQVKQGLPSYEEVLRVPFCPEDPERSLEALKSHYKTFGKDIACFMVELMQGDGGCYLAGRDFFIPLFEFCKEHKMAIWVDEVQTFARSGEFFAFDKLNLGSYVDVCTIGKAMQLSVSLWTNEYNPKPGLVSGTFASSSSSLYSGLEVLNVLDEQNYMGKTGQICKVHKQWMNRLKTLEQENLISEIEGWGLMIGATPLKGHAIMPKLLQLLFQKGLMCYSCGVDSHKRLRFLLPAVVKEQHMDMAIDILRESILKVKP